MEIFETPFLDESNENYIQNIPEDHLKNMISDLTRKPKISIVPSKCFQFYVFLKMIKGHPAW